MKAAVIAFYEAYPPVSGAAAVSFNIAKFLPTETLLVQVGSRPGTTEVQGVRLVTVVGASESRVGKITGLRARIRAIVNELVSFQPDFAMLEGASWAMYHWVLLRAIRRALPQVRVVYHAHNVEYVLRRQRNGRAIAAITRWAEGRLLRGADLSTAVSAVDQEHLMRLYGVRPILLPNGVDVHGFAGVGAEDVARMRSTYGLDGRTVLFSGFYAYPPNRKAVDFLANSVMPQLRERYPSATLALTGGGAPYHEPWIRNVGSVPYEDFAPFVAACGVAVAPIFSGSGTRLKILEAMAAGVPVVATEKAAEGLGLTHGEHFLRASNLQEFVNAIAALFENPVLAANLQSFARHRVKAEFSWQAIVRDFDQAIAELTETGPHIEGLTGRWSREARV
jgi:glycosyltransferase involved in cell wall biosynthesis